MKKLFLLFTALLLVVSCNQPTGDEDLTVDETPVVVEEKVESEKKETFVEETPTEDKKEVPTETKNEVPAETKTETKVEVPAETPTEVQTSTEESTETSEETNEENQEEQPSEESESENEQEEIPVEDKWIKVLKAKDNLENGYKYPTRFLVPEGYDPKKFIFGDNTDPSVDYDLLKFEYVKTVGCVKENYWCLNNGDRREGRYFTADVYEVLINEKYDGDYLFIYYKDIYTEQSDHNIAYTLDKIGDVYYLYSAAYAVKKGIENFYSHNSTHTAYTQATLNRYKE